MDKDQLKRHIQKSDLTALEKRYLEEIVDAQHKTDGRRLIDADYAKSKAIICTNAVIFGDESEAMITFASTLQNLLIIAFDEAPTVEAEPIQHGYWIHCKGKSNLWYCSKCGGKIIYNPARRTYKIEKQAVHEVNAFCRKCGVQMIGHRVSAATITIPHPTREIGRR